MTRTLVITVMTILISLKGQCFWPYEYHSTNMGHAKMWTQIYPVFPLRGGPYHVTNYLVLWEEVVMAWLWPVDCLLDNSLHPPPRCSPAYRRTEHSWAAALTFKLLLVTKIHPWPTFSKSFDQVQRDLSPGKAAAVCAGKMVRGAGGFWAGRLVAKRFHCRQRFWWQRWWGWGTFHPGSWLCRRTSESPQCSSRHKPTRLNTKTPRSRNFFHKYPVSLEALIQFNLTNQDWAL